MAVEQNHGEVDLRNGMQTGTRLGDDELARAARLAFLGVGIDEEVNASARGTDADLTAAGARTQTKVVTGREDLEIARAVEALLGR